MSGSGRQFERFAVTRRLKFLPHGYPPNYGNILSVPMYDYLCGSCQKTITVTRSYQERETDVLCPQCGLKSSRVYNSTGIIFKGTGFYKTDNR